MNAVRDVASALGDLIHATKSAAGKPSTDPAMLNLKDSAKVSSPADWGGEGYRRCLVVSRGEG